MAELHNSHGLAARRYKIPTEVPCKPATLQFKLRHRKDQEQLAIFTKMAIAKNIRAQLPISTCTRILVAISFLSHNKPLPNGTACCQY